MLSCVTKLPGDTAEYLRRISSSCYGHAQPNVSHWCVTKGLGKIKLSFPHSLMPRRLELLPISYRCHFKACVNKPPPSTSGLPPDTDSVTNKVQRHMLISDMFYRSDDTTNSIKALKEGIGSFTMGHLGHAPTL